MLHLLHFPITNKHKKESVTQTSPQRWITNLSFAVEAQNLNADTRRSSSLDFVKMSEQVKSCSASAIVQLSLCKHTK